MDVHFTVASIFTDSMVLQRERSIPVWGTAPEGETVTVGFLGEWAHTRAGGGKWRVDLPEAKAGGPYEMKIQCAGQSISFIDVMVGEVWIAGGQSNMEYALKNSQNGHAEIPAADYPGIRVYTVPRITHENLPEDPSADAANAALVQNARWRVCSPDTAGDFYAVAFHFAKELHRSLAVPVGIIECAWGGTSASCWMRQDLLSSAPETRVYLDEYLDQTRNQTWEEHARKCREYDKALNDYNERIKDIPVDYQDMKSYYDRINAVAAYPWPPALGPTSPLRPCGLYRTMFRKITPYGVRGVIFYQGETDTAKPTVYEKLFSNMMDNWRQDLENPALPFVIVQLAAFANGNDGGTEYALLREQQSRLAGHMNCTMAVAFDCGHRTNIHPVDKKTVGERLAAQAKANVYGMDVPHAGPEFQRMEVEGGRAALYFRNPYGELVSHGELTGFQMAGEDRKFVLAGARIDGNRVILTAKGIDKPAAVRYGFCNYAVASLFNSAEFPAAPFQTDDWI